jgi:hypothetical protein
MPDEVTNISEVKRSSDGNVTITVETYNDLVKKIADQKNLISSLNQRPPVINRTTINKTAEMAAKEYRMWGGSLMGIGATMFVVGAALYRAGM